MTCMARQTHARVRAGAQTLILTFDTRGLFFDGMGIAAHGTMSMIHVHVGC